MNIDYFEIHAINFFPSLSTFVIVVEKHLLSYYVKNPMVQILSLLTDKTIYVNIFMETFQIIVHLVEFGPRPFC